MKKLKNILKRLIFKKYFWYGIGSFSILLIIISLYLIGVRVEYKIEILNNPTAIIALISLIFSLYYSIWYPRKKKCKCSLVWDDLLSEFYIVIYNSGQATLIIESVELFYIDRDGIEWSLGKRNNLFNNDKTAQILSKGQAMSHIPTKSSNYDVFGYRGHAFDVCEDNKDRDIYIRAVDIDDKEFTCKTNFKLGEIDHKLIYSR